MQISPRFVKNYSTLGKTIYSHSFFAFLFIYILHQNQKSFFFNQKIFIFLNDVIKSVQLVDRSDEM